MSNQAQAVPVEGSLELVFGPPDLPDIDPAEQFHHDNPHVLQDLLTVCYPYRHLVGVSPRGVWELLRLQYLVRGVKQPLPNNHTRWYARKIMATKPEWAGMFRTIGD